MKGRHLRAVWAMQLDILVDAFRDVRSRLDGVEVKAARFRDSAAPVIEYLDQLYWPGEPELVISISHMKCLLVFCRMLNSQTSSLMIFI